MDKFDNPSQAMTLIRNGSAEHIWPELITLLATMAAWMTMRTSGMATGLAVTLLPIN